MLDILVEPHSNSTHVPIATLMLNKQIVHLPQVLLEVPAPPFTSCSLGVASKPCLESSEICSYRAHPSKAKAKAAKTARVARVVRVAKVARAARASERAKAWERAKALIAACALANGTCALFLISYFCKYWAFNLCATPKVVGQVLVSWQFAKWNQRCP